MWWWPPFRTDLNFELDPQNHYELVTNHLQIKKYFLMLTYVLRVICRRFVRDSWCFCVKLTIIKKSNGFVSCSEGFVFACKQLVQHSAMSRGIYYSCDLHEESGEEVGPRTVFIPHDFVLKIKPKFKNITFLTVTDKNKKQVSQTQKNINFGAVLPYNLPLLRKCLYFKQRHLWTLLKNSIEMNKICNF